MPKLNEGVVYAEGGVASCSPLDGGDSRSWGTGPHPLALLQRLDLKEG